MFAAMQPAQFPSNIELQQFCGRAVAELDTILMDSLAVRRSLVIDQLYRDYELIYSFEEHIGVNQVVVHTLPSSKIEIDDKRSWNFANVKQELVRLIVVFDSNGRIWYVDETGCYGDCQD